MKLLSDLIYVDQFGTRWAAPKSSVVDGASIPKLAWSFIGGPFEGRYRDASVIHDVACVEKKRPWEDVHLTFYNAMRCRDVEPWRAKVMYAAVYHGGPRWPYRVGEVVTPPSALRSNFLQLAALIESGEMQNEPRITNAIYMALRDAHEISDPGEIFARQIPVSPDPPPPLPQPPPPVRLPMSQKPLALEDIRNFTF